MNDEDKNLSEYYNTWASIMEPYEMTFVETITNENSLIEYEGNKYKLNNNYSKLFDLTDKEIIGHNKYEDLNKFILSYIKDRLKSEGVSYEDSYKYSTRSQVTEYRGYYDNTIGDYLKTLKELKWQL